MRIDNSTNPISQPPQPSNPYHIARAYGARSQAAANPVPEVSGVKGEAAAPKLPTAAQALVAGVVPGGVEFRAGGAAAHPSPASFEMYRHPADKNAAATAVQVGKRLDVNG